MAIATDLEVTWINTADSTNKIGLSKPFTELPANVWADDSIYVTAYNNVTAKFTKVSDGYPTCPVKSNDCPWYLTGGIGYSNIANNSDSFYLRSAIICVPDDFIYDNWNGNQGGRIRNNINNFRIVTSMSVQKNGIVVNLTKDQSGAVTGAQYIVKETVSGSGSNGGIEIGAGTYKLLVVDVYTVDGNYYLNVPYSYPGYVYDTNNGDGVMGMWAYDSTVNKMFSISPQIFPADNGRISITGGATYNVNSWVHHALPDVTGDTNLKMFVSYVPWNWYLRVEGNTHYHLLNVSRYGLKFTYDGDNYKPLISQGVVTGYTTDMSQPSDIDNWTNISGHNITPIPPAGGITDKEHEMPLAYIGGNAGMVTFYEINKSGLASADDISDAISRFDIATIGKDLLRNFISFKAFAAISVDDTVDRQIKIAGIPLEDSGGNALTGRVIGGVKPIDLFPTSGGVTIPTLYNDYRDYEPFTRIQMYVPFCGWFTLPSWCIGKKITGTMFTDLYNGTVKAVIYASQTVVAEVGGCCAYDIPFVADATGAKASAVISSALTTAAAVGATVAMPNVATGIAAVSSAANLAATLNGNDTTLKGVLGDGSNLNGLLHVYIKVSRPMSPNGSTTIPDSYKHEIGIPTMKEVTTSKGDGYIQVMDAKVTGTMTAREKQMIVDGFRHGLNF